jgi:hypothetical protein
MLDYEGTKKRRKILLGKMWDFDLIIGTKRLAPGRNTENWHKIGVYAYISEFKEKWKQALKKYQVEYVP